MKKRYKIKIDDIGELINKNKLLMKDIHSIVYEDEKIEDTSHLSDFLLDVNNRRNFITILDKMNGYDDIKRKILARDKERDIATLAYKLDKAKKHVNRDKVHKYKLLSIASVAVAAIVLSFIIIFKDSDKVKDSELILAIKIDKPTLIFDSGEKVSLDDVGSEVIEHTNVRIGKSENKLNYNVKTEQDIISAINDTTYFNTLIVPSGYNYDLVLSDGTEVCLNAGSQIKYPTRFPSSKREIIIEGEAFFKVSKQNSPFIVKAGDLSIKVYGTEFNVNYVKSLDIIETVLVQGSVGVYSGYDNNSEYKLKPNQSLIFNKNNFELKEVCANDYKSWMNGLFRYKKQSLQMVINDLAIWYDVKFNINTDISSLYVTLTANRSDPVDDIISFISNITDLVIIKEGKGVYSIENK